MKEKIYVAGSCRNGTELDKVHEVLRTCGFNPLDFRDTKYGKDFKWWDIDPKFDKWTPRQYVQALDHKYARERFDADFGLMAAASACVLVWPSGRSAHLEAGWFVAKGKPVVALIDNPLSEPELMIKMCDRIATELIQVPVMLTEVLRGFPVPTIAATEKVAGEGS